MTCLLEKKKSKDEEPEGAKNERLVEAKNERLRAKVTCLLEKKSKDKKPEEAKKKLGRSKNERLEEALEKLGKALEGEKPEERLGKGPKGEKPEEAKKMGLEEAKKKLEPGDAGVSFDGEGALEAVGSRGRLVFVSTDTCWFRRASRRKC